MSKKSIRLSCIWGESSNAFAHWWELEESSSQKDKHNNGRSIVETRGTTRFGENGKMAQ